MAEKYDKIEVIGSGSFGKAWLALRADSGKKCVLKEIQVVGISERSKKQALTEVTALARCKHVNVIRYKDAFVHETALWIAMEYADGGDLHAKIKQQKQPFEIETILDWFVQISFALKYIHSLSIIHRDLKTQNIFLTSSGLIKIGDLGIARILKQSEEHALTAVGTPYYLSPEICKRQPYDYKTDMWASGCVLYEMCTGKRPFAGPSCFSALVLNIIQGKYKPIPNTFGPILEDLVRVLLKVNPESRPTAEQVLAVPALRPYIMSYVKRTRAMRARTDSSSSQRGSTRLCSESQTPKTGLTPKKTSRKVTTPDGSSPVNYDSEDAATKSESSKHKRKSSLSTPRRSPLSTDVRTTLSAQPNRSPNANKKRVGASPVVSLYKEVLTKRLPLSTLNAKNASPMVNIIGTPDSPVANRTRKRLSPEQKNKGSDDPSSQNTLRRDVYMCHLKTCTHHVDQVYNNMETVREFLESRLGSEKFVKLFIQVREMDSDNPDMASICNDPVSEACFPLFIHLLQLELLTKQ